MDRGDLIESIALSPIAMVVTNPRHPDNPIELVNDAFCDLTGYSKGEIFGRNCRFLTGELTEAAATEQIRSGIRASRPVLVDILNYRRDGSAFRNGVMITPLFGDDGKPAWFLGSQVDLGPDATVRLAGRRSQASACIAALPGRQRQVLEMMARDAPLNETLLAVFLNGTTPGIGYKTPPPVNGASVVRSWVP